MARRCALLGVLLATSCAPDADPAPAPAAAVVTIRGTLLDREGAPAAGCGVRLELGRQAFDLGEDRPVHASAAHRATRTSDDGAFVFEGVPADARVQLVSFGRPEDPDAHQCGPGLALVRGRAAELARGPQALRVRSGGTVTGRIVPFDPAIRLLAEGGDGRLILDSSFDDDGRFTIEGLPPGDAWLFVSRHGEGTGVRRITVPEGGDLDLGPIERPRPSTSRAPEVRAERVRFVDAAGAPVPDVKLVYSTPSGSAGTQSDAQGELLLKGGGVYIGEPPYRLSLHNLSCASGERRFSGVAAERDGVVVVTLTPKTLVRLTLRKGGAPTADAVVAAEDVVFEKKDGAFEAWLPPGRARLRVGTVQGTVVEKDVHVPAAGAHAAAVELP